MSIFSHVPIPKARRTPFNLNNSVKFTTQFGYLEPTRMEKVVPGDVVGYQNAYRIDFAPLSTKLLQEFRIKTECFFVPTRILWKGFEEFFVAVENEIIHPYFNPSTVYGQIQTAFSNVNINDAYANSFFGSMSLLRKLYGCIGASPGGKFSAYDGNLDALRVFAYFRIMAEYYLDENLQHDLIDLFSVESFVSSYQANAGDMSSWLGSVFLDLLAYNQQNKNWASADFSTMISLGDDINYYCRGYVLRNYPKDYFTSALPWKQKGTTVNLPLSSQNVNAFVQNDGQTVPPNAPKWLTGLLGAQKNSNQSPDTPTGYTHATLGQGIPQSYESGVVNTNHQYIKLKTEVGNGVTSIDDFRTAYQLQQWLERNARGGTRYKEQILAHFGIKTKDSRLDRPEFIMGTTGVVSHGDVFTTYQDEAGNGVPAESVSKLSAAGRSSTSKYSISEHGYFINLFSIYPKASYNMGLFRQAMELDKFDYFWPEFQHLGEQEIFRGEIDTLASAPSSVFGYTPRYAQYKSSLNDVCGEFASNLLTFTDTRIYSGAPNLNSKFIQIDALYNNLNRIFNVINASYDKIYVDFYNNLSMLRPMSYYGIPRLVL